MKNFRKVLALALAVIMTVSTFTVAFAADAEKTSGEILKALGLLSGNASGDLMEDKTITRAEVAEVIVKIMNWELEPESSYSFADVAPSWAVRQIATLKAKGVTNGVGENKFGAEQEMDALQTYAWIYAAVTGETASAWENPNLLTAFLSEAKVAEVIANKNTPAQRGQIFTGLVDSILKAEIDGKTQIDKLIEAGKVTKEQAVEAGLKEAEVPAVENVITSVELLNYKEAKVVFTGEASDKADDYKFGGKVVKNVTRSEDKKEVILLMDTTLKAQDKVTFNYKKDSYEFEKKDLEIIDTTVPSVVDVKTTDKNKLTITFSEAIDKTSSISVKVNNGMLYTNVGALSADGRSVVASVSSLEDGKEYKVEISGAKDYAGYVIGPKTIEAYKYESVKDPVTVSVKEATQKKIVLSLSAATEKVVDTDIKASNFTYILASQNPKAVTLSGDKKEVTLDITGYQAPEGTWELKIKDADKMFEDSWGNKAAAEITLSFTVVVDKTAPTATVKEWKQADKKLVVAFNEAVDKDEAVKSGYYKFLDAADKEITGAILGNATASDDRKEYTFTIDKTKFNTEKVTLVIEKDKIADDSGNKLAETKISLDAKFMRTLEATVKAVESSANKTKKLYVTFTNNMLAATTDVAKWAVSAGEISSVAFDEGSTKVVIITLKADTDIKDLVVTTSAITDVDGNTLDNQKFSYSFGKLTTASFISSTTTMTAAATASQTVKFSVEGNVTDGINADAFKLDLDGSGVATATTTVATVNNVEHKEIDGKQWTIFTLTLPASHKLDAKALADAEKGKFNGEPIYITATGLVLNSGVKLDDKQVKVTDSIAPVVNDATVKSAASKTLTFATSEKLTGQETLFATELVVKYDGKALVAGNDYGVAVGANFLTITLKIEKVEKDKEVVVSLAKESNYVTDDSAAKNKLGAFEKTVKLAD